MKKGEENSNTQAKLMTSRCVMFGLHNVFCLCGHCEGILEKLSAKLVGPNQMLENVKSNSAETMWLQNGMRAR